MEIEALLAPISEASPSGEDMSFSIEFDQIAEMRREDDPTLDQGEWVTTLKVADWPGVAHSCAALLGQRTKDLRLAMWLTESWALTRGYAGLDEGLQLCTQLCARYWDTLHPQADGGDQEERIGNMGWLLQRVVALAPALPVTKGRQGASYSLRDLAAARQAPSGHERPHDDANRAASDKVTLDQFNRALKETPAQVLMGFVNAAHQAQAQLLAWQNVVDTHLGADGPGFVQAKEALAQVVHELDRLARESGALHAPVDDTSQEGTSTAQPDDALDAGQSSGGGHTSGGPLRTRAQALQQLRDVANFFRRTEPHSPVAYLADKAVTWGEMPLHEWLRKVVKDPASMSHLQELLGLEDQNGEGNGY